MEEFVNVFDYGYAPPEVLRGGENSTGADFDAIEAEVRSAQASGDLQVEELAALVTQARALWR